MLRRILFPDLWGGFFQSFPKQAASLRPKNDPLGAHGLLQTHEGFPLQWESVDLDPSPSLTCGAKDDDARRVLPRQCLQA